MHIQIGDAKGVSIATRLIGNHKVILNKNIDLTLLCTPTLFMVRFKEDR